MSFNIEVKQKGYKDCGPACLLSIIHYYGGDISIDELSLLLKTDNNGTSAYNIIKVSKELGFDSYGISSTFDDLINNSVPMPFIAHVIKSNYFHYINVFNIDKSNRNIKIMDPSEGLINISYDSFKTIYLDTCIIIYPNKKIIKVNRVRNISTIIYKYKKFIIKILLYSIIVIIVDLLCNFYIKIIVDKIIFHYNFDRFFIFTILFLSIFLSKNILSYIKNFYLILLNNKVYKEVHNKILRHVFNLPYLFFKNKSIGEVTLRINDINIYSKYLFSIIFSFIFEILIIVVSLFVIFYLNYKLGFIVLLFSLFFSFIIFKGDKKIKNNINDIKTFEELYNKNLAENILGYETNKNINLVNNRLNNLTDSYGEYVNKIHYYQKNFNFIMLKKDLLFSIFYIFLVFICTMYVINNIISIGNFIFLVNIFFNYFESIKNILNLFIDVDCFKETNERIKSLILIRTENEMKTNEVIDGNIEIIDLYFSYNNIDYILENINLTIKNKDKIIIYGPSGNGKSTLIKIILKYLNEYKGIIKLNNINIDNINSNVISNSFTYVSQNSYINNDTIKNNIIYGREIDDKKYKEVIKICNIDKFIKSKKTKDNFLIEDDGFNISGGEKQKIVLARSLLKESNYIILDEALSEVSIDEEKEIINRIILHFKDKTIIYISHKREIIDLFENKYYLERRKNC